MSQKFVKRVGQELHDLNGKPFLLKGVGIGSWLLIEGYMLKSFGQIDRPSRFKEHIVSMTNEEYAKSFFNQWHQKFFTEDDVKLIKESGFNSIRIAIDYQFLFQASDAHIELPIIEENFELLDHLIAQCKEHGIYIILDLHAAPGGQTGTNIDNSKNDQPLLFEHVLYQNQFCYVWKEIAKRYKNEQIIAAYDLINEPLPNWFSLYNEQLIPLYKRVISSIRSIDEHHMITLEGLHWSTDWSCFQDLLDENVLLQFHKYWSNPDKNSIKEYTNLREKINVPIFMGEGGENNLEWYYAVFKMYQQLNISYNFWTYKKMDNHNSIISFEQPKLWDEFLKGKLNQGESIRTLNELLKNIEFCHCKINKECINAILQKNTITIPAYGFDYHGQGVSYSSLIHHESSFRTSEGLSVVGKTGQIITPNFKQYGGEPYKEEEELMVFLQPGEWVKYTFHIDPFISQFMFTIQSSNQTYQTSINGKKVMGDHKYSPELFQESDLTLKISASEDTYIQKIYISSEI